MTPIVDPTAPLPVTRRRRRVEQRALGLFAVAAVAVMLWVAKAMGVGIFLGALTAFMLQPLYERVLARSRRPWVAQLTCLSVAALAIHLILSGISLVLVARGSVLVRDLIRALEPGGSLREQVVSLNQLLTPLGVDLMQLVDKVRDAATEVAGYAAAVAGAVASKTFGGVLVIFFLLLTTHFVLVRGPDLELDIEAILPISPKHTRALLAEFRLVGRATLLGSVATGLAQGLLAVLVFTISGLPEPVFFGVATAVASLLPGVGTMLVWVPAGIYLIATGHAARGVIELVLSAAFVIGFCDYYLRPRLVGGESMPALLTFAALFGGVEALGLIGLLVGPLLMAIAVAILRLYREDVTGDRKTVTP